MFTCKCLRDGEILAENNRRRRKSDGKGSGQASAPRISLSTALLTQIEEWSEEACEAHGVELVDVEVSTSGRPIVRVFAQRPGNPGPGKGITIDECAQVSRFLEAMLDAEESLPENYMLEVSSPGIERPLKKLKHFEQVKGSQARVVLKQAREGIYVVEGEVLGADLEQETVSVRVDADRTEEIAMHDIKKAHVVYDFSSSEG